MSQKIIFLLIISLILATGGFFYFLKGTAAFSTNPFLASLGGNFFKQEQKKEFSLSEEEFSSLSKKIAFLEKQLKEEEMALKNLDDFPEKFDELNQKIKELEATIQSFDQIAFYKEMGKVELQKSEDREDKEDKELNEKEKPKKKKENAKEKKEKIKKETKEKEKTCQPKSINLNSASVEELEKITEIGPIIAQKIIASRPFYLLNDLLKVKGISEKTLQKIIAQGCVFVDESYSRYTGSGGGGGGSGDMPPEPKPAINLSYSQNNPVDKQIKIELSISNLKNATYDVKISIEAEGVVLSEIYNQKENKWQLSFYYLKELFSSHSFKEEFQLRIKEETKDFKGEADIFVKIRQSDNKRITSEFKGKINITNPELTQNQTPIAKFIYNPPNPIINQEIVFDASSSTDDGTITTYIWDFGDGNSTTTNIAITSHSYSTSSDFIITLLVVDNLGVTSTAITTISVLSSVPAVNLLLNPGFETGSLSPWVAHDRVSVVTELPYSGTYSAKFTDLMSNYQTLGKSEAILVEAGRAYKFGGWLYVSENTKPGDPAKVYIRIRIEWYSDAAGAILIPDPKAPPGWAEPSRAIWVNKEWTRSAPSTAISARLHIEAYETINKEHNLYIDDTLIHFSFKNN